MTNSPSNDVTNTTNGGPLTSIGDLVTAIDHVGLAVPDLDAAAAWWLDNFGFANQHEEVNEEQGVREAMIGPENGDTLIQLLMPLNEESTIAKFIDRNGPGMQQMAVRVTDLDEVAKRLTSAGVRLLYPQPKRGTADSRINFVHPKDAGGVLLELVEPAVGH
ncbi:MULTISPECIES: methylmalonyl-CoA epimerase [Gordonia]|uniref:methylmalonyl-CoA epimerase n=1 Tax=Gordonia TaxID=2053 RepID=UPI000587FEC1|nr:MULTISPECIES: methylmalonyl-CoA epimerase [Gordonia]AUH69448.1 methylmalonyl-CoA epimerase [Gordonia sp. YC-JH1]KJR10111.1 methylmalonyl-CoA epimerase [Gordonia sihwensis]MBY4570582.1 methylmalonyl-CoA epimerase [Gordonia sihwensis]WFN94097.1 methylmalonyl-CoA epimerase [Gordonia sihwensis]